MKFWGITQGYKKFKVACSEKKIWNGSNYGDESLPQDAHNAPSNI